MKCSVALKEISGASFVQVCLGIVRTGLSKVWEVCLTLSKGLPGLCPEGPAGPGPGSRDRNLGKVTWTKTRAIRLLVSPVW